MPREPRKEDWKGWREMGALTPSLLPKEPLIVKMRTKARGEMCPAPDHPARPSSQLSDGRRGAGVRPTVGPSVHCHWPLPRQVQHLWLRGAFSTTLYNIRAWTLSASKIDVLFPPCPQASTRTKWSQVRGWTHFSLIFWHQGWDAGVGQSFPKEVVAQPREQPQASMGPWQSL